MNKLKPLFIAFTFAVAASGLSAPAHATSFCLVNCFDTYYNCKAQMTEACGNGCGWSGYVGWYDGTPPRAVYVRCLPDGSIGMEAEIFEE